MLSKRSGKKEVWSVRNPETNVIVLALWPYFLFRLFISKVTLPYFFFLLPDINHGLIIQNKHEAVPVTFEFKKNKNQKNKKHSERTKTPPRP